MPSFRFRLAIFSALLGGLTLVAFGGGTWWLIRDLKLVNIDREVRLQAEREAPRNRTAAGWRDIEARLVASMGLRDGRDLILHVSTAQGDLLYRSPHWPASLDPGAFKWPRREGPRPGLSRYWPLAEAHAAQGDLAQAEPRQRHGEREAEPLRPAMPPASDGLSITVDGDNWRAGLATAGDSRVLVAVNARSIAAEMSGIRNAFLLAMPVALLLIGAGSWWFAGGALRPLRKLTVAARQITAAGLDQRIPAEREDKEFRELIDVFNGMLERLERSFQQAHRFSADAAHELKTPLAILQGQLERAIQTAANGSQLQADLTAILDEVRRLSTISRKLLLLAQADAGRLNLFLEPYDLSAALADLVEDTRMLAPHLRVEGRIHPGILINADSGLLQQVLHNLISNAIKYNIEGGWITIQAALHGANVEVVVANSSLEIPDEQRQRIFERFFRADRARTRQVEGVGLGLSLSREIARAHSGDLSLHPASGGVVRFSLILPKQAMAQLPHNRNEISRPIN